MSQLKKQVSVFIGRFSPFHNGHARILEHAVKSAELTLVVIGSGFQSRSLKNPFTNIERGEMIMNWYKQLQAGSERIGSMVIVSVRDYPYNDSRWIAEVQYQILKAIGELNVDHTWDLVLTGASKDSTSWYLNAFGTFFTKRELLPVKEPVQKLSATYVRELIFTGRTKEAEQWVPQAAYNKLLELERRGILNTLIKEYAYIQKYRAPFKSLPYEPAFITADAVVIQSGHVLVITRRSEYGDGLWALPGGFVEPGERFEAAAIRELKEETDIELAPAQLFGSIKRSMLCDLPDRDARGRVVSMAYLIKLKDTCGLPKVKETAETRGTPMWVPIAVAENSSDKWFADHGSIFSHLYASSIE